MSRMPAGYARCGRFTSGRAPATYCQLDGTGSAHGECAQRASCAGGLCVHRRQCHRGRPGRPVAVRAGALAGGVHLWCSRGGPVPGAAGAAPGPADESAVAGTAGVPDRRRPHQPRPVDRARRHRHTPLRPGHVGALLGPVLRRPTAARPGGRAAEGLHRGGTGGRVVEHVGAVRQPADCARHHLQPAHRPVRIGGFARRGGVPVAASSSGRCGRPEHGSIVAGARHESPPCAAPQPQWAAAHERRGAACWSPGW